MYKITSSNDTGNYSIDLVSGNYLVKISSEGYIDFKYYATVTENQDTYMETFLIEIGNNQELIPEDSLKYNGHSYYIFSIVQTWEEAKTLCESYGGYLAVINNEDENTALYNYMTSCEYQSAYFEYSDAEQEGSWKWVNNDISNYTNWATGEPNSENSKEDYAMFYYKYEDEKWNDGDFGDKQGSTVSDTSTFICEWNK